MITLINHPRTHKVVSAVHAQLKRELKGRTRPRVAIDELNQYMDAVAITPFLESIKDTQSNLGLLLDTAFLATLTIKFQGMAVIEESKKKGVYRSLHTASDKSEVDSSLGHYLLSLSQTAFGITMLCMTGSDASARSLLRVFIENSWTFVALSGDRDTYEKYWEWHRSGNDTIWWKEFRWKELQKKVFNFEKKIEMPSELIEWLTSTRNDLYKYYSQSIHLAPIASVASNYVSDFTDGSLKVRLLLGASKSSRRILEDFILASSYFLIMQRACMQDVHSFKPNLSKVWWNHYWCCYDYFTALAQDVLLSEEK